MLIKNQKMNIAKLTSFGFVLNNDKYEFTKLIMDDKFKLVLSINEDGEIKSDCYEIAFAEKYAPFYNPSATGNFVGKMREINDLLIEDITKSCFSKHMFNGAQAQEMEKYVLEKYGSVIEPWEKFPSFACLRRNDNRKWYGLSATLDNKKLGIDKEGKSEIVILRNTEENVPQLLSRKWFLPAYGLNKKYWFTIVLNQNVPNQDLFDLIDESYKIIGKK